MMRIQQEERITWTTRVAKREVYAVVISIAYITDISNGSPLGTL